MSLESSAKSLQFISTVQYTILFAHFAPKSFQKSYMTFSLLFLLFDTFCVSLLQAVMPFQLPGKSGNLCIVLLSWNKQGNTLDKTAVVLCFGDLWGSLGCWFCWFCWCISQHNQCHVPASHHVKYVRLYYTNFTISFLVTGFVVGLLGGSLGSGGEMYDFHTPFLQEISGRAAVMWKF